MRKCGRMVLAQVNAYYQRRDIAVATGDEEPCSGCNRKLEPKENYSIYGQNEAAHEIRGLPESILLCQKCTYIVIGSRMA